MSETVKHTPGPWNYTRGEQWVAGFYGTPNARRVADRPEGKLTDWNADARLISAAPDMLDALREAEHLADVMEHMTACRADDEWVWAAQKKIKDAIAKATGGSNA